MTIDRIFIAFMALCGLIVAFVFVVAPQTRDSGIPAYFWILIPMAMFEGVTFFLGRRHGAPGPVITAWTRLIGFFIAIALILAISYLAGHPVVQLT